MKVIPNEQTLKYFFPRKITSLLAPAIFKISSAKIKYIKLRIIPKKIPILTAIFEISLAFFLFFAPSDLDTMEVTEIETPIETRILKNV